MRKLPLFADPETELIQGLGAWGEKKMYGKVTHGPMRSTFVMDKKGKILRTYPTAKGHAQAVLDDLKPS